MWSGDVRAKNHSVEIRQANSCPRRSPLVNRSVIKLFAQGQTNAQRQVNEWTHLNWNYALRLPVKITAILALFFFFQQYKSTSELRETSTRSVNKFSPDNINNSKCHNKMEKQSWHQLATPKRAVEWKMTYKCGFRAMKFSLCLANYFK